MLDREREAELARRYRATGDRRALHALVTGNLRFVVAAARRYRDRGVPTEDLINEGNLGMLRAAERFDPDRGVRFVTYADWFVRQGMLAAVARAGRAAPPIPSSGDRPGRPVPRATVLSLDVGSDPSGEGSPLRGRLADPAAPVPGAAEKGRELRRALRAGLAFLPRREQRVLRLYFGLDDTRSRTLADVGRELGVSRERARQLKDRALRRLREGPHGPRLRALTGRSSL